MKTKSLHTAFKALSAGIADNFSTEYAYDRNGNVTSMKKAGLLSAVGDEYGQVDNLTMQYEGNQLTRVDDFADDPVYDGAPGFNSPDGEGVRTYDERGNLSSDTSRGITRITYNWQDQPNLITFDNDHRQVIHYDGYGNKTDVSYQTAKWQTINNRPVAHYFTNHTRYYRHGRVILKPHLQPDSLEMTQFDFGYFDAEGKPCYQLHDYRGNVAVVVAASGKVLAHNRYYSYGEAITRFTGSHAAAQSNATATAARYRFGAKEHETMHGLNSYDFGPRLLSASLPVWDCPDRQQERYHPLSPYTYCAANPIRHTDPSGEWHVEVHASSDRALKPYGTFSVFTMDNILIFRTIVKLKGNRRDRAKENNDTPQGEYDIIEWRKTGAPRYNVNSFGSNDLLALDYQGGEGGDRNGMHVHGGREQGPELRSTHGCMRMLDEDIKDLKDVTDRLTQNNPDDKPEDLTVTDDLLTPVTLKDREEILIVGPIDRWQHDRADSLKKS